MVRKSSDLEDDRSQGPPARCSELVDDDGSLRPLEGINPVEPHHPGVDKGLGDDEAPHEHDGEQRQGTTGIGHYQVPGQRPNGSEEADGHVVHQEQQKPVYEKPADAPGRVIWLRDHCMTMLSLVLQGAVLHGGRKFSLWGYRAGCMVKLCAQREQSTAYMPSSCQEYTCVATLYVCCNMFPCNKSSDDRNAWIQSKGWGWG